MKDEYIKNNTWELVPYHANQKIIDNKWLFKIKEQCEDSLDKLKYRVVSKIIFQIESNDFVENIQTYGKTRHYSSSFIHYLK